MTGKLIKHYLVPLFVLMALFGLQVQTELGHILQLPTPGWSRALTPSQPLETEGVPFIQTNGSQLTLYTTRKNQVLFSKMTDALNVQKQIPFSIQGPIEGILWGKGESFIYQKEKALYLYKNTHSYKISDHMTSGGAARDVFFFSDSFHLYELLPKTVKATEIAGFASPIISIQALPNAQILLVATENPTSKKVSFFLLKDGGDHGYTPLKLGWIQPKTGEHLQTAQLTELNQTYFILIGWRHSAHQQTRLEEVQLNKQAVQEGQIGQPKGHFFTIQVNGKILTTLHDLHLGSTQGNPSLLFLGDAKDGLENTVFEATETKNGIWQAETRSHSFLPKTQPFWGNVSQTLIGWRTPSGPKKVSLHFVSHRPKLIDKSLQPTLLDIQHAVQDTRSSTIPTIYFILTLLMYAIPAFLIHLILLKWRGHTYGPIARFGATMVVFLAAQMQMVHHALEKASTLPTYLTIPWCAVLYVLGAGVVSGLYIWLQSGRKWPGKWSFARGFGLFFLSLALLFGPYFQ